MTPRVVVRCAFCDVVLTFHAADRCWVDGTDGDACSGDDDGVNENGAHVPAPN